MNKINELFKSAGDRKLLSLYFCAGCPTAEGTADTLRAMQRRGIDMVEVGIPFSDPMADGPVIQDAATRALRNGMTLSRIFAQLKAVRDEITMPLVLMGYLNPILQYGIEPFCRSCVESGVSGAIIPDLPFKDYMDVVKPVAAEFKVVYTPFHGAGYKLVPEALRRLGVKQLFPEPKQMVIDGNFPTVESPNPENPEGFYLAVDLAKQVGSDLIIGTDPDSDRVGTMVRGADGEYHTITGNQMGVLLLDYIISARRAKGTLPANAAFIKTIVTTNMGREIAERNGIHVDETFTGFKFMAEKLAEYKRDGSYEYILAYEESYGYMMGDYVRDKDAVTASMMIAEMAAYYFSRGMTLADALEKLYEKYGWFEEKTLNLVMPGLDGLEKMKALMASLRAKPPKEIGGTAILGMRDYQSGKIMLADIGVVGKTHISGSNVLYFELADGTAFIVRPSGTEPKIKVYILAQGESREQCDERVARYAAYAEGLRK